MRDKSRSSGLGREWCGVPMAKRPDKAIQQIEQSQEALRRSIEQARELAEKAHQLVQKQKNDKGSA